MIVFEGRPVVIEWVAATRHFEANWRGHSRGAELREALEACIQALALKQASAWLANVGNFGPTTQEDQRWITEKWFPRFIAAGCQRFAVVMPGSTIASMGVEAVVDKIDDDAFQARYFTTVGEARSWLTAVPTATEPGKPAS